MHYDTHEVFVLQLAGAKKWTVWEAPFPLVRTDDARVGGQQMAGTVAVHTKLTLRPGELLYVVLGLTVCGVDI